jgi:hypothetical protein
MCSVRSKAEYVENFIKSLAKKHGLAVYDPQSDKYISPDSVDETTEQITIDAPFRGRTNGNPCREKKERLYEKEFYSYQL